MTLPTRTLKDYRPQHDAGCAVERCSKCGHWLNYTLYGRCQIAVAECRTSGDQTLCDCRCEPRPCSCGLDHLLAEFDAPGTQERTTEKNDSGAGLIHQTIPDVADTEPRLSITELENWLKLMDHDRDDSTPLEDAVVEAIEALKACGRARDASLDELKSDLTLIGESHAALARDYNRVCDQQKRHVMVIEPNGGPVVIHWQRPNGEPTMTQTITYESVLDQVVGSHGKQVLSEASGSAQSEAQESSSHSSTSLTEET